ncbi:hypothetical protein GJ496_006993 [Pomphorhynchus laevis]|nr:hypothetical protein GJ496_006993 [Pomphorhynchus laevis]
MQNQHNIPIDNGAGRMAASLNDTRAAGDGPNTEINDPNIVEFFQNYRRTWRLQFIQQNVIRCFYLVTSLLVLCGIVFMLLNANSYRSSSWLMSFNFLDTFPTANSGNHYFTCQVNQRTTLYGEENIEASVVVPCGLSNAMKAKLILNADLSLTVLYSYQKNPVHCFHRRLEFSFNLNHQASVYKTIERQTKKNVIYSHKKVIQIWSTTQQRPVNSITDPLVSNTLLTLCSNAINITPIDVKVVKMIPLTQAYVHVALTQRNVSKNKVLGRFVYQIGYTLFDEIVTSESDVDGSNATKNGENPSSKNTGIKLTSSSVPPQTSIDLTWNNNTWDVDNNGSINNATTKWTLTTTNTTDVSQIIEDQRKPSWSGTSNIPYKTHIFNQVQIKQEINNTDQNSSKSIKFTKPNDSINEVQIHDKIDPLSSHKMSFNILNYSLAKNSSSNIQKYSVINETSKIRDHIKSKNQTDEHMTERLW